MDPETQRAVARALDVSITDMAEEHLTGLTEGVGFERVAQLIVLTLNSLERLQDGELPDYDAWDAPFYAVWYQPVQVNLAYTLIRRIPRELNPLLTGSGSLHVSDFGCGEFATVFGLAFAAADVLKETGELPEVHVSPEDKSEEMRSFGRQLWDRFKSEISDEVKYAELGHLRRACDSITMVDTIVPQSTRWLTVFHVAYLQTMAEVKDKLDTKLKRTSNDIVLVTAHPRAIQHAFVPGDRYWAHPSSSLRRGTLALSHGEFDATSNFRMHVANELLPSPPDSAEYRKARSYLTAHETSWSTPRFQSRWRYYVKK